MERIDLNGRMAFICTARLEQLRAYQDQVFDDAPWFVMLDGQGRTDKGTDADNLLSHAEVLADQVARARGRGREVLVSVNCDPRHAIEVARVCAQVGVGLLHFDEPHATEAHRRRPDGPRSWRWNARHWNRVYDAAKAARPSMILGIAEIDSAQVDWWLGRTPRVRLDFVGEQLYFGTQDILDKLAHLEDLRRRFGIKALAWLNIADPFCDTCRIQTLLEDAVAAVMASSVDYLGFWSRDWDRAGRTDYGAYRQPYSRIRYAADDQPPWRGSGRGTPYQTAARLVRRYFQAAAPEAGAPPLGARASRPLREFPPGSAGVPPAPEFPPGSAGVPPAPPF